MEVREERQRTGTVRDEKGRVLVPWGKGKEGRAASEGGEVDLV